MNPIASDISIVITTYNNPKFLEIVLKSVISQRVLPIEVIIADDGSTDETRLLISKYAEKFPVPLIHSWIPDEGFRVAKSRNIAIAKTTGKYVILLDGDIVVTPHFVADHAFVRKSGCFVTGSRARLNSKATKERCETLNEHFGIFTKGLSRRLVMMRSPFLHRFIKGKDGLRNARSCHMAFWREDFIAVNGFEENFEGWGFEDSELVVRFYNHNLHRINAKLLAPAVHLHHKESSVANREQNRRILQEAIDSQKKRAILGVDQYL